MVIFYMSMVAFCLHWQTALVIFSHNCMYYFKFFREVVMFVFNEDTAIEDLGTGSKEKFWLMVAI